MLTSLFLYSYINYAFMSTFILMPLCAFLYFIPL